HNNYNHNQERILAQSAVTITSTSTTTKSTNGNSASSSSLSYITIPEFDTVPKYILNRLTREKINEAIDDFNKLLADKYRILKMNTSSMNQNLKARYWEYKEAITEETKGKKFITENDIKNTNLKINLKMDATGRAIFAVLRHVGKLKEVRGGGKTR
ncbi:11613_t:CDS:2, partial [Ambispora leptoticha]